MGSLDAKWRVLPPDGPLSAEDEGKIRVHLAAVLQSNPFRTSPRCQEFLSHAVELTLAGKREELKERLIGVQLFGRSASYDTGEDPIVRVKANEVRKRLAQFYEESSAQDGVKITLPAGTYVPQFLFLNGATETGVAAASGVSQRRLLPRTRRGLAAAALVVAAVVAGIVWFSWSRTSALDRFWEPLMIAKSPLLVNLGTSELLRVSPAAAQAIASAQPGKEVTLPGGEVAVSRNEFISIAHFRGLLEVFHFCQRYKKRMEFRPGVELSADELRSAPILFVGAFSNPWTLRQTSELRFRFERVPPGLAIIDTGAGGKSWRIASADAKSADVDYALITRLVGTNSQGPRILAGGLTRFGTQAALDFLAQPDYWKAAARQLPSGWEKRNVQLVLQVNIVAGSHQPAVLVASHVW